LPTRRVASWQRLGRLRRHRCRGSDVVAPLDGDRQRTVAGRWRRDFRGRAATRSLI